MSEAIKRVVSGCRWAFPRLLVVILLALPGAARAVVGLPSVSDVRVGPLLTTHWNQALNTGYVNQGELCYNYYTPNNYKTGCSATALAQILRYWEYPQSTEAQTFDCLVDGKTTPQTTLGGPYAWGLMADDPAQGVSEDAREAIGRLLYDCAVVLRSQFAGGATQAFGAFAFDPLRSFFGYTNAVGYLEGGALDPAAARLSILASLDAGSPVLMSILAAEQNVGHAVVVDGYGYDAAGVEYFHLNFGQSTAADTSGDAWYPLLDATHGGHDYTIIDGIVYNIFPMEAGDVLSGRVLWADGTPATNVTVKVKSGSAELGTVQTDARGIYAFLLEGGKNYTVSVGRVRTTVALPKAVSPQAVDFETGVARAGSVFGNSWGNDLSITPDVWDEDPLGAFGPQKAVNGVYPFCGVVRDSAGQACGTLVLKVGKASKKGVAKVSGTLTGLDGKKYSVASASFDVNEAGPSSREDLVVKKFGTMDLTLGENGFTAQIHSGSGEVLTAESTDLSKGLATGGATFRLSGFPVALAGDATLADCSPDGERIAVDKRGKWTLGKAASVKYKKFTEKDPETGKKVSAYRLVGLDDPKKPNRSGLKLTYSAKTGLFKGSFSVYCDAGTETKPKLKKYTFAVTGLVFGGTGVGVATCKKPSVSFGVAID